MTTSLTLFQKIPLAGEGPGSIIAAVVASTIIYSAILVWRSDFWSKNEKYTIIFFMLITGPLFFLAPLIAYLLKKGKTEAGVVLKTDKGKAIQTERSIDELRSSGIISEEEFLKLKEKADQEELNREVLRSTPYKGLKDLLEKGLITQNEFEEKVNILVEKFKNGEISNTHATLNKGTSKENLYEVDSNSDFSLTSYERTVIVISIIVAAIILLGIS